MGTLCARDDLGSSEKPGSVVKKLWMRAIACGNHWKTRVKMLTLGHKSRFVAIPQDGRRMCFEPIARFTPPSLDNGVRVSTEARVRGEQALWPGKT
jgi:hypothetical protein